MTTLLQINASLFRDAGQSSRLADKFVELWQAREPGAHVIKRDLAHETVPHLTAERFQAFLAKPAERNDSQQALVALSDTLIEELKEANVIVLGLPMYNFGVPSTLKAYFDHVARAGVTFRYTDAGPQGLLTDKQVYVFATRGGRYAGTASDTETQYVRDFLQFVGMSDIEFIYAEGLAHGESSKVEALGAAATRLESLAQRHALAA